MPSTVLGLHITFYNEIILKGNRSAKNKNGLTDNQSSPQKFLPICSQLLLPSPTYNTLINYHSQTKYDDQPTWPAVVLDHKCIQSCI